MPYIVIPQTATEQGDAFEDLILSHYQRSSTAVVREWSTYLHGNSGQWWQCDGIVEDNQHRYLIEAKFFRDRPASPRDIDPARRQSAALDTGCTAIRYISLNGFSVDMLDWKHSSNLKVEFTSWPDLRGDVMTGLTGYASTLLDEFDLQDTSASARGSASKLRFEALPAQPFSAHFPEFVTVPDRLELWLRRMPGLALRLSQTCNGTFWYDDARGQVDLIPQRATDLSLQEAWEIEDAFSGYAARTYPAVRATAQALALVKDGTVRDVQQGLKALGWDTGPDGIRNSLDFLILLGLAHKQLDGRTMRYRLSPLGRGYASDSPDSAFFAQVLRDWPPYRAMCTAIDQHVVTCDVDAVITYFRRQYTPYIPYAKSLFNPNKAEGLLRLYKTFGA